jgi:hypothetical protein
LRLCSGDTLEGNKAKKVLGEESWRKESETKYESKHKINPNSPNKYMHENRSPRQILPKFSILQFLPSFAPLFSSPVGQWEAQTLRMSLLYPYRRSKSDELMQIEGWIYLGQV